MRDRNAPLSAADIGALAWDKMDGLLPAIVQDAGTGQVLMLGYMNAEALEATLGSGFATFYSRSKARLWQKGERSGNRLAVRAIFADCDSDALLVTALPEGPTCHLGTPSCFSEGGAEGVGFLAHLARIVRQRAESGDETSYTARLLGGDPARLAQKIGEEGVELALAAVTRDAAGCVEEAADLLYHLTVLMEAKGFSWDDVTAKLRERHR
ncbi:bifunctional phosphoribosyl-AMP cyclohydrolase/phosphoribosyl-ATP diphosphatase HisIE [Sphingosinicella sp. LY1275]|uniref:bifunctional phosphoribosyl-AMP cyclohydrolase/phosphoribosyl-ATP diphosphatase HisIE n=1 Tax=Sphingosinicella sp. LY1275 TaxID=3095379 RepID=UPI002ADEC703|nr:bifunctional phosphoribosyl-AMP cyclohydrolase/phosphoribosyl-ATP diphosphatase HisIE [Sphingosinicella sp. LY1275]MEA1015507.1 bifunctional phosphoribosyl-AMP cyclohydrolase/phosphoribosyl-ATP diphosphatase HisIE [Sphingosinicella sp. LY1275]